MNQVYFEVQPNENLEKFLAWGKELMSRIDEAQAALQHEELTFEVCEYYTDNKRHYLHFFSDKAPNEPDLSKELNITHRDLFRALELKKVDTPNLAGFNRTVVYEVSANTLNE